MPQIKKLADGKYLVRVSRGTGKRRTYINNTFNGTLQQARAFAREKENLIDQLKDAGREINLTFERYLEIWLGAIKSKIAPRTHEGYSSNIRRYALDLLAKYRLTDIRGFHIQAIYNEVGVNRSPTTVRNLHASLNACFSYALKREYISSNPCRNLDLPQKVYREVAVLDPAEARAFIQICREMPNGLIFEFAIETGMRPEEYLALRWSDFRTPRISVSQVVQYNRKGGGFYFAKPKTAKSRRMITLSDDLCRQLVTHRRLQNEHRIAMKGTWFRNDLIFPDIIGNPYPLNNLTRRYFKPILDKMWPAIELPDGTTRPHPDAKHITLYALRHTCATLLLLSGANAKVVADRLGHASVVMTLDIYSHVLPDIESEAAITLHDILRRGL